MARSPREPRFSVRSSATSSIPTATSCSGTVYAFEKAATALEAVIAKGNRAEVDRDFHFIMTAASYHLAHLSARAYSLLAIVEADESFAPLERVLALLMRRSFRALHTRVLNYR